MRDRRASGLACIKQRMQSVTVRFSRRFHTMATTLAVDVLGCTGTTEERAGLLHKMIQIAAELKSTMGNMFGFAAIMRALELPQVCSQKTPVQLLECVISSLTSAHASSNKPLRVKGSVTTLSLRGHGPTGQLWMS